MRRFLPIVLILFFTAVSYSQMAVVIGENAYLRGSAVETGAIVDTLKSGAKVAIIKQQGPWFLVQSSPFVGWMHGNSLRLTTTPRSTAPLVANSQPPSEKQKESAITKSKTEEPAADPPSVVEKRVYIRGPRGGCYYVRPDGKKVYGDHGLCGS